MIINFLAGPGAGKSTLAAGLYYELKKRRVNCELVREYAKDLCWVGKLQGTNSNIITQGQFNLVNKVFGKVPIIIHDTSLLLGSVYGQDIETCLELDSQFRPALNIFVKRGKDFEKAGRLQNRDESIKIDQRIIQMLERNNIDYLTQTVYHAKPLCDYIMSEFL